ncbi:hypothetical protein H2248_007108 [Termitomyces sp. 'cryptogamus']|nr:hypothetical protein H2248_007108 [Termitomyces sp. 'cryptogamus']
MDGLLVFAALFSAVVTTFVVQTSQVLQPDNTQILVSLLSETNQLLRAAVNSSAVSPPALGPGSPTYTSTDQWVNGLFFTSLALSLSTALLTVLAKQWIQAYTSIVPGSARTRALIRHFRYKGLVDWRLGDIIESLPIILHSSVAIFLVGLALYASQFSSPICGMVASITAPTFLFYLGTSIIPAICLNCPYRLPFLFPLSELVVFIFHTGKCALWFLGHWLLSGCTKVPYLEWPTISAKSLKTREYDAVFPNVRCAPSLNAQNDVVFHSINKKYSISRTTCQLTVDAFNWVSRHSSNSSVREVVFETVPELLSFQFSPLGTMSSFLEDDLITSAVLFALEKCVDIASPTTTEDEFRRSPLFSFFQNIINAYYYASGVSRGRQTLLNGPFARKKDLQEQIQNRLEKALCSALSQKDYVLTNYILRWSLPDILLVAKYLPGEIAYYGNKGNISYALDHGLDVNWYDADGKTLLHFAMNSAWATLDVVMFLVERKPSLIHLRTHPCQGSKSALDIALRWGYPDIIAYLLDKGADRRRDALHVAVKTRERLGRDPNPDLIKVLLDRGYDRTDKDMEGQTPVDIAKAKGLHDIVEYLLNYQTARIDPITGAWDNRAA